MFQLRIIRKDVEFQLASQKSKDKIKVILNGEVILDGDIAEATKSGTADHKEHPGLLNKTGHIGFLGHGDSLRFRNLRIKDIVEPILTVKKKKKS